MNKIKTIIIYGVKKVKEFFTYYIKNSYRHLVEDEALFLTSGIAFNVVLCLIPILLILTSMLGFFLESSDLAVDKIQEILNATFPQQPYAQNIKESIQQVVKDIIDYRRSFGIAGLSVLVWTAGSLFGSARTVLNRIYKIKSTKLMILTIMEDVLWVIVIGVLFVILMFSTWLYTLVENFLYSFPGFSVQGIVLFEQAVPILVSLILTLLMFFIAYRFIPDQNIGYKVAFVSAITASVLWEGAGRLFGWYLSTFHSFGKLYGTYAFILVFLFWIYYTSLIFIIGATFGQIFRERHHRIKHIETIISQ